MSPLELAVGAVSGQHEIDAEELRAALMDLEPIWAELFPQERARVLNLLLERIEYDAAAGEVALTFRPDATRSFIEASR